MTKYRIQLDDISAIGAGKTAIIKCPITAGQPGRGLRYHRVTLGLGNTAAGNGNAPAVSAIIGNIRCSLSGKIQREVTGTRLDVINTANGAQWASKAAVSGGANGTGRTQISLFFNEPWRKRSHEQDALAWQTGYLGDKGFFYILVDIVAGITPILTAFAVVDEFDAGKPHPIMKWFSNDFNAVGTPITVTELERRDAYSQISLFDTSDGKTVDNVKLTMNSRELHNLSKVDQTTSMKDDDMNPAAGAYHVVFDQDDSLEDVLVPTGVLNLKSDLSAAAAGTLTIVSQRLGLPEGFGG